MAQAVAREAGGGRVLSPSYSLPQPVAVIAGLELADGIDPLQLASYRDFMAASLGFSPDDYSVTLPPFPDGDPTKAWAAAVDSQRIGLLNVSYVLSAFPLEADGLTLEERPEGTYVYRNANARPRAWIQPSVGEGAEWTRVDEIDRSVDLIRIRAMGPGTLVVSQPMYPGWHAAIDGRGAPIETVYGVLQAVQLTPGEHDIEFAFRPGSVYFGASLTLLSALALAWLWSKR
jgi:hypothetical protein